MLSFKNYIIALGISLLPACANIVSPTGGPKDTSPPKITHEHPDNFSKNFTGNSIIIEFDEYVQLNNPTQEIVISPAIDPQPEFPLKGKQLIIRWKETLDSATTYTIAFGEALKDANESNTLSGLKYVFSTGNEIDSLSVTGDVIIAKEDKPAEKVLVMLYKDVSDSVVIKKKPFYFTKTNVNGKFSLENIKAGEYKIFALKDENYNYLYDLPNEEIAFANSALTVKDSVTPVNLFLFKENRKLALKLISKNIDKSEYVRLNFSGRVGQLEFIPLRDSMPIGIPEFNAARDSVMIWYTRAWEGDSVILKLNGQETDTFTLRNQPKSTDALKENLAKLTLGIKERETYPFDDTISVLLNRPIQQANFENVILTQDSPQVELKYKFIRFADSTQRKIEFDFARSPGTAYTLLFPPGTFTDYFGNTNDSLNWHIVTKTKEDFGSLKLTVTGQEGRNYIIQLLDGSGAIAMEKPFVGSTIFNFTQMLPGTYQPLIIYDENANKKWDTGNYLQHLQPEDTYRHTESIALRANWDMEVELKIK